MKPVSTWGDNWAGAGARATTSYKEGVQSSDKDWQSAAQQAVPRMVEGFNQAAADGRIAAGIGRVSNASYKQTTLAKATNYTTGYTAGADNYRAAAQKLGPAIQAGVSGLPPRGDINQNLERSRQLALYLHSRKGTLGARA